MSYVTELRSTDVLFGRGSGPNDHEGNIRFRQRVADRKDEYLATNHRMTKSKIAKDIVDSVLIENGRFLRKAEEKELANLAVPNGVDVYVMVDEITVMEKAKQALRQNAVKPEAKPKKQTTKDKLSAIELNEHNPEDYEPIPIGSSNKLSEDNPEDFEPIPIVVSSNYRVPADQEPRPMRPPATVSSVPPSANAAPAAAPHWDDATSRIPVPENFNTHVNAAYRQGQTQAAADSNMSMAQLTNEFPISHKLENVSRNHSMNMVDLMDSFTRMKTNTNLDEQKRMMASAETMGTIDHLPGGSVNDMNMSMGSSTFSFFKGNDSMMMNSGMFDGNSQNFSSPDRITLNPPHQNGASNAANSNSHSSGYSHMTSESSISLSDVWSSGPDGRRKSSSLTHSGITGEVAISVQRVMDEVRREEENARNARLGIFPQNTRQEALDEDAEHFNMSDLGSSNLDLLKPSLNSNNTFGHDIPSDSSTLH